MKNSLVILSIGTLFSTSACAQENSEKDVPETVKTAFTQKFPSAKKVSWEMESPSEWEAEFKLDGKEYSSNFSTDGIWKETEHEIKTSEIPDLILNIIEKDFAGFKIEEAEISESPEGSLYEIAIEKGEEEWELVFDANGKLIEKIAIEEDED